MTATDQRERVGSGGGGARGQGARPRLLFLCQTLPYPPDGGVAIRSYHIMRLLAERYDVTALCFFRVNERPTPAHVAESVKAISAFAEVEAFPIPQEHRRIRLFWDHLRSVLTRRPYTVYAYESDAYRARLREVLKRVQPGVVHMDSLDLSGYLNLVPPAATVCVHHNVESALLRRRADAERSWWRRAYLHLQAELLEAEERRWCPRLGLNVAVSPDDRAIFEQNAPGGQWAVVPNGVDVDYYRPGAQGTEGLVCVGATTWFPNRDALFFFCNDIQPHLKGARKAPVRWVGRSSPGDRETCRRDFGVELTGYVDDTRPYLERAACFIVPLRVGGGTRLKILNAWAMGKAIVSTSIGCEGLDAVDGENMLIRDTAEGFAEAIDRVTSDEAFRRHLGAEGRRTAERVYSWDIIGRDMAKLYEGVAKGSHHPA
ncbi:MAG TPA: glycosyltransferase [Gemmatimonadales bacterium]|nr:glycosyltransferase [Gemmatimonadales bacterium]